MTSNDSNAVLDFLGVQELVFGDLAYGQYECFLNEYPDLQFHHLESLTISCIDQDNIHQHLKQRCGLTLKQLCINLLEPNLNVIKCYETQEFYGQSVPQLEQLTIQGVVPYVFDRSLLCEHFSLHSISLHLKRDSD
ncbi:unnamed protein product, partial [Didymodactylos carnosus]